MTAINLIGYLAEFIISNQFYNMNGSMGLKGTFIFYGAAGLFGAAFVGAFVPETTNQTLADIQKKLNFTFRPFKTSKISPLASGEKGHGKISTLGNHLSHKEDGVRGP